MNHSFSRVFRIAGGLFIALATMILFAFFFAVTADANAEETVYKLGEDRISFVVTYGDVWSESARSLGEDRYYKVLASVKLRKELTTDLFDFCDSKKKVVAIPDSYYILAADVVACNGSGAELARVTCEGKIAVQVIPKEVVVTIDSTALTKVYGVQATSPNWAFKPEPKNEQSKEAELDTDQIDSEENGPAQDAEETDGTSPDAEQNDSEQTDTEQNSGEQTDAEGTDSSGTDNAGTNSEQEVAEVWTIEFHSDGFDAKAHVGEYPLTPSVRVTKGTQDVSRGYHVTVMAKSGDDLSATPVFVVTSRTLSVSYPKEISLPFNNYFAEDGSSVGEPCVVEGVNGDTVIAYFRMKQNDLPAVLTVGEEYELEMYRYTLTPQEGDPAEYGTEDVFDYAPILSAPAKFRAKAGSVTLYQNANLRETYANDPAYFYLDPALFTYTYLSPFVEKYAGEIEFKDVALSSSVTATLVCTVEDAKKDAAIPAGRHRLSLKKFTCPAAETLVFEEGKGIFLTVEKRNLGKWTEEDGLEVTFDAEFDSESIFTREVLFDYGQISYKFTLTADLGGKKVGDVIEPSAMTVTASDESTEIDYSEVTIRIVKRSTGVTLIPAAPKRVAYKEDFGEFACLYVDYGTPSARAVKQEKFSYSYQYYRQGEDARFLGLPSKVGNYVVICSIDSEEYVAEPVEVSLEITRRMVTPYFEVAFSSKTYGESVAYTEGSTMKLVHLYLYDSTSGETDRTQEVSFSSSEFSGTLLTTAGLATNAVAGSYPFDVSGFRTGDNYSISASFIVYDTVLNAEVKEFTVNKGERPATPMPVYRLEGNAIVAEAAGSLKAKIAQTAAALDTAKAVSKKNSVRFSDLTYGATYYLSVCVTDDKNYVTADSEWSEVKSVTIPFASLVVNASTVTNDKVVFTCDELKPAVSGYEIRHRVGLGEWETGLEITGLKENTLYTIAFRAQKGEVVGETTELKVRTLRSPVESEKVEYTFNRATGMLTVSSSAPALEYRLLDSTGAFVSDSEEWVAADALPALQSDSFYTLQVRFAKSGSTPASEITEIEIDTYEHNLFALLSDWFLLIVAIGLLIATVVFIVLFVHSKRKVEREELEGD